MSFEREQSKKRPVLIYGLVAIGIAAIAIGVISVVAANWRFIPANFKLLAYMLMQIAAGVATLKVKHQPTWIRDGVIGLFALLFFAGIGLTGQVFHLSSNGWSALLFWWFLALPAVCMSQSRPLPYLWMMVLLSAECIWLFKQARSLPVSTLGIFTIALLYGLITFSLWIPRQWRIPPHLKEAAFFLPAVVIFMVANFGGTWLWYDEYGGFGGGYDVLTHLTLPILVGSGLVCWSLRKSQLNRAQILWLSSVFFGHAIYFCLPFFLIGDSYKLLGVICHTGLWWLCAVTALKFNLKKLFDAFTLLIVLRLLVVYFEIFGSMLATGFGLIISGLLILGGAWVWYRYRDRLAKLVQGERA